MDQKRVPRDIIVFAGIGILAGLAWVAVFLVIANWIGLF